ncbi:uncharacterized protein LOC131011485 isoform X2 [Salvia miltiorrhiza]|uniref:uncharacterized protein LOC131011485 isoform X2 n=1 Tax=Salvia miltiorrhiza TaxID=226208 RepID=UPI0025ACBF99|nr:uncharacterized protein LOC131011485 isoform X2 [Salvia miltiorrhiza]
MHLLPYSASSLICLCFIGAVMSYRMYIYSYCYVLFSGCSTAAYKGKRAAALAACRTLAEDPTKLCFPATKIVAFKEPAFRRLIFITMLAWENPLRKGKGNRVKLFKGSNFQKLVGEEAFVRIAPVVSGVADCPTAHNLFRALAGEEKGVSFSIWSTYITELVKVHEGRKSYQFQDISQFPKEKILCLGSSRKQPVLKWENDMAWPGKVTLTDRALYFEAASLVGGKDVVRLDLTHHNSRVEKTRVGPYLTLQSPSHLVRSDAMSIYNANKGKKFKNSAKWETVKAPRQPGGTECGFFVMRYMKEIVQGFEKDANISLPSLFTNVQYSQVEIDEVREEWAKCVLTHVLD